MPRRHRRRCPPLQRRPTKPHPARPLIISVNNAVEARGPLVLVRRRVEVDCEVVVGWLAGFFFVVVGEIHLQAIIPLLLLLRSAILSRIHLLLLLTTVSIPTAAVSHLAVLLAIHDELLVAVELGEGADEAAVARGGGLVLVVELLGGEVEGEESQVFAVAEEGFCLVSL